MTLEEIPITAVAAAASNRGWEGEVVSKTALEHHAF
jgi:hypothetical protein